MCVCGVGGGGAFLYACMLACVCWGEGEEHLDTCMHVHICICVGGCGHVWVSAYECV